ncbi:hypothetical protein GCM10011391_16920 [Pullulanibacillus camelliae]|uniref:Heptaprenyl diphosphate synthase n=1 Tax=Pullulanibacillus camelliae TaxID=1707096 RepID=A0A8J2VUQ0_9BACL|nr:heptaprenyl diphosphate synthase component 1 [Pullulanibacillus camelliae]GGE38748.1 hypothetical protein GCM10011391_16920 [Pullulanibacillus camelliae]
MNNELKSIKKLIQQSTQHPVLDQYIQRPEIDDDKLLVLTRMFSTTSSFDHTEKYIASIMIVQMALEIHDSITLDVLQNPSDIKARQLMVLAGDYYSAQYYRLLAELEDFQMIGHLSDAIRELNEYKTEGISGEFHWQRVFDFFRDIESTILSKVANILDLRQWMPMITRYFTLKRILHEAKQCRQGSPTQVLQPIFQKRPEKKKQFLQAAESFIEKLVVKVEKDLQEGPPFLSQLSLMTAHWNTPTNRVAEEGLS